MSAVIKSAPQRLQIGGLAKGLLNLDPNSERALLAAAVGDLAQEQPIALVYSYGRAHGQWVSQSQAQTAT